MRRRILFKLITLALGCPALAMDALPAESGAINGHAGTTSVLTPLEFGADGTPTKVYPVHVTEHRRSDLGVAGPRCNPQALDLIKTNAPAGFPVRVSRFSGCIGWQVMPREQHRQQTKIKGEVRPKTNRKVMSKQFNELTKNITSRGNQSFGNKYRVDTTEALSFLNAVIPQVDAGQL